MGTVWNSAKVRNKRKRRAGFTLIELLIVVAIMLILAAIALPNFIRSKISANEAATVQNMRNTCSAEVAYTAFYGIGYAASFADLGGTGAPSPTNAGLIDDVLATGTKSGYQYIYTATIPDGLGHFQGFTLNAQPVNPGATGQRYFYVDQTYIIRRNLAGPAGPTDSPL